MSDQSSAGAEAPISAANPLGEDTAFTENFAAFMGSDFSTRDEQDTLAGNPPEPKPAEAPAPAAAPVAAPTPAVPEPAAAPAAAAPAAPASANAEPSAATTPAAAVPPVSAEAPAPAATDAELAAFLGVAAAPAPASTPGVATPAAPAASAEEEVYAPFTPTFKLPPQLLENIFMSDDMEVRGQALVTLLAQFGNAVLQTADIRAQEYHYPKIQQQVSGSFQAQHEAQVVAQDFYGTFPELANYKPAVTRALEVLKAKYPVWNEEARNAVGELARKGIEAGGIKLPPRPGQAVIAPAAPAAAQPVKASGALFEAGGARPGGGPAKTGEDYDAGSFWKDLEGAF